MTPTKALTAAPLGLELGPRIASSGFVLGDYEAVVAELSTLRVVGMPERAVAKRRAEFLAGRFAASRALALLGSNALPGRHADGRPLWPAGIVGSITHGGRRALCAVARSSDLRSLGIDTEQLMEAATSEGVRSKICTAAERELLGSALGVADHAGVTLAFSAKESLYKCLYPLVEKFIDFHAVAVVSVEAHDARAGELRLELREDVSEEFVRGTSFRAPFVLGPTHVETAVLLERNA